MKLFLFSVTLALLTGSTALATAELELTTGGVTLVIIDSGSGDTNPSVGEIAYSNTINGWNISVFATSTSPNDASCIAGAGCGLTLTDSLTCTSAACVGTTPPSELAIGFSDIGFTTPVTALTVSYAGSIEGAGVTEQFAYLDDENTHFGSGLPLGVCGPTSLASFNSSNLACSQNTPESVAPYSLTLDQVFSATAVNVGFDPEGQITTTPEPANLWMLCTVLVMLIGLWRRALRRVQVSCCVPKAPALMAAKPKGRISN